MFSGPIWDGILGCRQKGPRDLHLNPHSLWPGAPGGQVAQSQNRKAAGGFSVPEGPTDRSEVTHLSLASRGKPGPKASQLHCSLRFRANQPAVVRPGTPELGTEGRRTPIRSSPGSLVSPQGWAPLVGSEVPFPPQHARTSLPRFWICPNSTSSYSFWNFQSKQRGLSVQLGRVPHEGVPGNLETTREEKGIWCDRTRSQVGSFPV